MFFFVNEISLFNTNNANCTVYIFVLNMIQAYYLVQRQLLKYHSV